MVAPQDFLLAFNFTAITNRVYKICLCSWLTQDVFVCYTSKEWIGNICITCGLSMKPNRQGSANPHVLVCKNRGH